MPAKQIFHFSHQAMSTFFEVYIAGQDEIYSRSAAQAFFREIDRLELVLSRFDPGSEISMINRLPPGESMPVGVETFECLKAGFESMVATGGAFNLNYRVIGRGKGKERTVEGDNVPGSKEVGAGNLEKEAEIHKTKIVQKENEESERRLSEELEQKKKRKENSRVLSSNSGFMAGVSEDTGRESGESGARLAFNESLESRIKFWQKLFPLELLEIQGGYLAVRLNVPGADLDLDLGAIGKGYALEKSSQIFSDWEISDFLVNAGQSTVYARGKKSWPVAVGSGFDFFKSGKISLLNRALSGSGHEVKGEHIFDPRQKEKKSRYLQVWVSHPSPTLADGLSTAFMVMSLDEIRVYVEKHPEVWTLVLSRDKNSYRFNFPDIYGERS
jgi:thiamine biosynthesis lipoprotein ApbE